MKITNVRSWIVKIPWDHNHGAGVVRGQGVEDLLGRGRVGPVVEGDDQLGVTAGRLTGGRGRPARRGRARGGGGGAGGRGGGGGGGRAGGGGGGARGGGGEAPYKH